MNHNGCLQWIALLIVLGVAFFAARYRLDPRHDPNLGYSRPGLFYSSIGG